MGVRNMYGCLDAAIYLSFEVPAPPAAVVVVVFALLVDALPS